MDRSGIKGVEKQKKLLEAELRLLRKGTGITPLKLEALTALQLCIAQRTGTEARDLSTDQMRTFLLYELDRLGESLEARAIRRAFAIDHQGEPLNLTARRRMLAQQLDRHPDTIESAENRGIKELVRRMVRPTTDQKTPRVLTPQPTTTIQPDRMTKAMQAMVAEGLGHLYSVDSHTQELIRCFGRDPYPYMDTSVEWTLLSSDKGSEWYRHRVRYVFRRKKGYFRHAVVASAQDGNALMASGLVDELIVVKPEEQKDFSLQAKNALQHAFIVVHDAEDNIQQTLRYSEIDPLIQQELLSHVWQVDPATCRLFEVQIPPERQKATTTYEYLITFDYPTSEHYAFWYSPGLMYLHNITVDVSRFPNRDTWQFFMVPFFGEVFPGNLEPNGDRFTMPANSWIMQGHGMALTWQQK